MEAYMDVIFHILIQPLSFLNFLLTHLSES
jgi:hypothetical protein